MVGYTPNAGPSNGTVGATRQAKKTNNKARLLRSSTTNPWDCGERTCHAAVIEKGDIEEPTDRGDQPSPANRHGLRPQQA